MNFTLFASEPVAGYLFVAAIGAVVGSFLSMLVYRLPIILKRQWERDCREALALPATEAAETFNIAWPASHCPQCRAPLKIRDNIPLFGYLLLRGRCRHCQAPIPRQYILIEALTTVAALVSIAHFGPDLRGALAFLLTAALIALAFIDMREQILPDAITLPFLWLGLLVNRAGLYASLDSAVVGAAGAYLFLWLVFHVFRLITGKEGMGHGDFKLFALGGAWLGWPLLPLVLLFASLTGALYGGTLIITGRQARTTPMPFGPFLCAAIWLALFYGWPLTTFYLRSAHG
ncbi:A24 family peptidase [Acidiferrobacter sp.]|jgi:leader peptidase (prepilin peptidase)/N-methyltransferase|uniref:prepilin peptidase n=1 Tax=Acidiferrobacter sp. TaxID=1872107 RepID=UPI002613A7F0|nr:A24 family peptidase [Acidiferrobacter sp.]